jgi:glycine oxidase
MLRTDHSAALETSPDVLIAGAGIVGLSLALELRRRGASVVVLDIGTAARQASWAAAGMLAVEDPYHPPDLRALARHSGSIYAGYIDRVASLSGIDVPFQTKTAIEYHDDGTSQAIAERSIDPRQLTAALPIAARAAGVALHENMGSLDITDVDSALRVQTRTGRVFTPRAVVHASGAWHTDSVGLPIVTPRKGQIFRVQLPHGLSLDQVHRRSDIYIVPRTSGPRSGTAIIGATVEDAGFDASIQTDALSRMRTLAGQLIPALADEERAPILESWVGFRPATSDGLPIMGALSHPHQFISTGHFRNGILLAPASAVALADLIEARTPPVDLQPFSAARFQLPT